MRPTLVLAVVAAAQFIVALDISIVNVALPQIRDALGFSGAALPWVVNAYTVALGGLLLLGGRLGDLFGRRRLLVGSLALFALASLAGGLAQSSGQLIACRALQGVAAAGLAPAALALLSTTFPSGPERARALAVWAAVTAAGGAVGVLLSGLLTELASWRWVLFVNVPIAAGALLAARRALPRETAAPRPGRLDLPGALLATGGATALVFGVLRAGSDGWGSPSALATLALAVVLLALFVSVERRSVQPLVRLSLLGQRRLAAANVTMALLCSGQFAAFYFVSLLLQETLGYRPVEAGLAFLPFCAGIVLGATAATRLLPRHGARALVVPGALLAAGGLLWFGTAGAGDGYLTALLGPMVLTSAGLGLCFVPVTGAATGGVAPREAGMAAGVANASRQIGGAIGLAALVAIGQPPALAVGAALMVLAAVAALALG
ncbi:MFS transporter [Conexibacter stalactiti]|uniref:MFS transporter n=1 Tax=Conexibacter stalactiti TaxID=1940611 RepID=A0ABU4HRN2_9ACTN|nr:MFS transporter [Conexibacter stalactiti]MDW5595946.1 MFS transporter [Conexibacter stalactiti]MEC5036588.1 MFS transporter [Conexibacter stalactiti]